MLESDGFVLIKGSGLAVEGPCIVHGLIFTAESNADYADIYDGLDGTSGKRFCRVATATVITWSWQFNHGVMFEHGVYVAGIDSAVETTVLFHFED